jgi:hypothetical protein
MWIIGTHHKTGSFLASQIWEDGHQLVQPPLKVIINSFKPIQDKKWKKLAEDNVDVVVTFHATGITTALQEVLGRPYKFVHIVRDPVEQLISAYLYEVQRITAKNQEVQGAAGIHDKYFKTVANNMDSQMEHDTTNHTALFALAKFMEGDVHAMATQYAQAEADHNALNIRLEDFSVDYRDTVKRMLGFLGMPDNILTKFMKAANREDLTQKSKADNIDNLHVTSLGKYDKGPLRKLLLEHLKWGPQLQEVQRSMGYG